MAYIVPLEMPTSCEKCKFHHLNYYRPFWCKEKPNKKGLVCELDKKHRVIELDINDVTTKADFCPLKEVKKITAKVKKG